jgi:shikimate kinase
MATGKTTIGKILSEKLGYGFLDTDQLIEEESGKEIKQIFEDQGESYFRKLEREAVKKAGSLNNYVIACGGGAVMDPLNVEHLKRNSKLVLLEASIDEIIRRTKNDSSRPLLKGKNPRSKADKLLEKRTGVYHKVADIIVDTIGRKPEEITNEILLRLEMHE